MTPGPTAPTGPGALAALVSRELRRTNFAGRTVTLAEGVAVGAGVVVLAARAGRRADAAVLAAITGLGLVDDVVEHRQRERGLPVAKGLRGHLGELSHGRVTTGGLKALGIPALALLGSRLAPAPRHVLTDAMLAAGTANLANLLDLRPGRALKALAVPGLVLALAPVATPRPDRAASGRALAVAALVPMAMALPMDLRERGMLGDAGANVLGAAVGTALARRAPEPLRLGALATILALTLASEKVSFSAVIARTPWLAALDGLGRRGDHA